MAKSKTYELAIKIAGKADSSLRKACKDADESLSSLGESAKKAAETAAKAFKVSGATAAAIATGSVAVYTEHEKAANSLAASTGAVGQEMENLQAAMETVYLDNFGESIEGVSDAVSIVNRNLGSMPTDQIVAATEAAISLSDAFDYSVEETTRAASAIEKNFGGSAVDAFSLIAAGAQNGLDYSGELIDTINEYSSQFAKLGFTADGMFNLLQSGADSTAWNLDKVGDAIKEFSIRSIDGSDATVEAFKALGYNSSEMMTTFATGGEAANQAFFDVLNRLMAMDDAVQRDALGVALFGTMWEDLGTEAMTAMANATNAAYDTQGALEQINAVQYNDLQTGLEGVKRQAEAILVTIGEQMAPYARKGLEYLSSTVLPAVGSEIGAIVPQLIDGAKWIWENKDAILAVVGAVGAAVGVFKGLQAANAAATAVKSLSTILSAGAKNSGILGTVTKLLGGKFILIAGIIAAVAAGFVLLWNKSERFRSTVISLYNSAQPLLSALGKIAQLAMAVLVPAFQFVGGALLSGLEQAVILVAPLLENIMGMFSGLIEFISGVFTGDWERAWQGVSDIFANLFEGLVNIAKIPINAVIGAVNGVIGAINSCSITIPDWVPVLGGNTYSINLPEIPMLASGGIATAATLAMVGEGSEPEAILPLSKLAALLDKWTKPKPGDNENGGDGDQIVFAPVFNFYGGASKADAQEAARLSFVEFKRMYKQLKAEEQRKNFAPT